MPDKEGEGAVPGAWSTGRISRDYLPRARTAQRGGTHCGEEGIPWFLGYSMLTYCPHSEAEMTVAGTPSSFDRM